MVWHQSVLSLSLSLFPPFSFSFILLHFIEHREKYVSALMDKFSQTEHTCTSSTQIKMQHDQHTKPPPPHFPLRAPVLVSKGLSRSASLSARASAAFTPSRSTAVGVPCAGGSAHRHWAHPHVSSGAFPPSCQSCQACSPQLS